MGLVDDQIPWWFAVILVALALLFAGPWVYGLITLFVS
jgi:hypothetical protein